jgi:predicted Zn-dependent peptidase
MPPPINSLVLENGLAVIAQPMEWLESAAFTLLVPAGCAHDPADRLGLANFVCEMVQRGCGRRDSRQFVEDLENLGVDRSANAAVAHTSFSGAVPAGRLFDALAIFADLVRRPHLPENQLEDGRLVCVQELRSLEDDLAHKLMLSLRSQWYPDPWGRSVYGTMEALNAVTADEVRQFHASRYVPNGAILGVAGRFDLDELTSQVESAFGDWAAGESPVINEVAPVGRHIHQDHESNQTHIGIALPGVAYCDEEYYEARAAIGVLSDGMSSRLFTEVREKRGLCYTVYALCHSLRDRGSVLCYAGASADRAQETLDVMLAEIDRLKAGIETRELDRHKARIKSSLIMQQESSPARSSALAADWYHLGRAQSIEEIRHVIESMPVEAVNQFLASHPLDEFAAATLGPTPLEVRGGVS